MGHTADIKNLLPDLAVFQPTFVLAVPRIFEKIYNGAHTKAHSGEPGQGPHLRPGRAGRDQVQRGAGGRAGCRPCVKAQHAVFDRLVYAKIRALLGGHVTYAVSGGGPLGARLGHFFRGVGVTVCEGYGLTESTGGGVREPATRDPGRIGRPADSRARRSASPTTARS